MSAEAKDLVRRLRLGAKLLRGSSDGLVGKERHWMKDTADHCDQAAAYIETHLCSLAADEGEIEAIRERRAKITQAPWRNADFIAHAPTDIDKLLSDRAALKAENEKLKRANEHLRFATRKIGE